jgi:excisionase family DNA binding protein
VGSLDQIRTDPQSVTPAEAARMLGVSERQVNRLVVDGRLPFANKSGMTHGSILVSDLELLAADRADRRAHSDAAVKTLLDGGLEY